MFSLRGRFGLVSTAGGKCYPKWHDSFLSLCVCCRPIYFGRKSTRFGMCGRMGEGWSHRGKANTEFSENLFYFYFPFSSSFLLLLLLLRLFLFRFVSLLIFVLIFALLFVLLSLFYFFFFFFFFFSSSCSFFLQLPSTVLAFISIAKILDPSLVPSSTLACVVFRCFCHTHEQYIAVQAGSRLEDRKSSNQQTLR